MANASTARQEKLLSCQKQIEQWKTSFTDNIVQRGRYKRQIIQLNKELARVSDKEDSLPTVPAEKDVVSLLTIRKSELCHQVKNANILEQELAVVFRDVLPKGKPRDVQQAIKKVSVSSQPDLLRGADDVLSYIREQLESKTKEYQQWQQQFLALSPSTTIPLPDIFSRQRNER